VSGQYVARSAFAHVLPSPDNPMDDAAISAVVSELKPLLVGRRFGKIFQFSPSSLAIDLGLREHGYLFISAEPALSGFYLIKRGVRDLEKQSVPLSNLALLLKKELAEATAVSIDKDEGERIVRLRLKAKDDLGEELDRILVIQLTGRAANLYLLDRDDLIIAGARLGRGAGQAVGEQYQPPPRQKDRGTSPTNRGPQTGNPLVDTEGAGTEPRLVGAASGVLESISEVLDAHYQSLATEQEFDTRAAAARAALGKKVSQRQKLLTKLRADLSTHADLEEQKRMGDLLLANTGTAKRAGSRVKLIDYFAEGAPEIEIEMDEKSTLPEEAARRFALYSRSKRARLQIASRIQQVESELAQLATQSKELERIIADRDETAFASLSTSEPPAVAGGLSLAARTSKSKREPKIPGTRRYTSSDGFEILVGRAARDNDNLTFKVARPNDLWLHAADYPGSHVVVRNSTRKEIPHRTIIEAAQLAAYFSQASKDPKVDVHYTPRKFLAKPKGAAPGLVRMLRFKSLTVAPMEGIARLMT